jgi:hypothetical protein
MSDGYRRLGGLMRTRRPENQASSNTADRAGM